MANITSRGSFQSLPFACQPLCQYISDLTGLHSSCPKLTSAAVKKEVTGESVTGERIAHTLCEGFKVKHWVRKTAWDCCGRSGLRWTVTMWRLFTEGQMKQTESNVPNPQLTVTTDYSSPLINVSLLFLSAPLYRRAALFRICLCEQLHYSPKPSHSITHTRTVCVWSCRSYN